MIHLAEGSIAPVACLADESQCKLASACLTLPMWKKLNDMIQRFFDGITLADLMAETDPEAAE